jgi:hypothetical protein
VKIREKPKDAPTRNVLAFGPPKSGKTLMAALTPPGPVMYLNADLPNATYLAHQRAKEGQFLELEFEDKANPVFSLVQELESAANTGKFKGKVQTVAIDPVGELYMRLLRELSDNAISPSLPTYQAVQTFIERMVKALCICPDVNVVVVAHDLPVKDEGTGKVERLPATGTTNPALGRKMMGWVDINAYVKAVDNEGGGRTFGAVVADRFDVLARQQSELNLGSWFEQLNAAGAPQTEAPADEPEPTETKEAVAA